MSYYDTTIYWHAYTKMNRTKIIYITAVSAILAIFILSSLQVVSQGKEIFLSEGCADCHSFKGHGGETAPDLTAVGERRSTLWIMSQIKDPKSHNPDSRMPEFGHLSMFERYAIAHYLKG
jgi:cbb3-type cytochrome oxidase cytochrome c subunit